MLYLYIHNILAKQILPKENQTEKIHTQVRKAAQGSSRGAQGPTDQDWHRKMRAQTFSRSAQGCASISPSCVRVGARVAQE